MKFIAIRILVGLVFVSPNEKNQFQPPVEKGYEIASNYGQRYHPILQIERFHNGIDWVVPKGTKVFSAAEGTIDYVGKKGKLGEVVIIDHGKGLKTIYANLSKADNKLKKGDLVEQGEQIAYSGNSGLSDKPHLHFMILLNDEAVNPLDYLNH